MKAMKGSAIAVLVIVLVLVGIAAYALTQTNRMIVDNPPTPSISMQLSSTAFQNNGSIPKAYTCDVENPPSPPLAFSGIPESAVSLALLVDDPDVPKAVRPAGVFDHWVLFNIPPTTSTIAEGGTAGIKGANGRGVTAYAGPCPPPQHEPTEHRYFFRLYALDLMLDLPEGATKDQVLAAMDGHILDTAELIGRYDRATSTSE